MTKQNPFSDEHYNPQTGNTEPKKTYFDEAARKRIIERTEKKMKELKE